VSIDTSVIVPVHNRAPLTKRCLDAVLADLPGTCEVVVVDDGSTDATAALLDGYGCAIQRRAREDNGGFARACNEGAAAARGRSLVFLNNDTEPRTGWLRALRRYAEEHSAAAVVGAKLLYPTGAVQHAGVVIGQDGYPHNLYAGLPADNPAVSHPRRLQAVTAACMLVNRAAFERADGFDTGFLNSLEDVDLCLRIGETGGEVHYCPEAVVVHLESASRGRQDRFERSVALYRERWRDRVRRDDLEVYAADGLFSVEYPDSYPIRFAVDPRLAVVDGGTDEEIEGLLEGYARQTSDLLQEVVRLTASVVEVGETADSSKEPVRPSGQLDRTAFLTRVRRLEEEIRKLQIEAEQANGFEPSARLGYGYLVEGIRDAVEDHIPPAARVLVVSRGDRELVRLDGRSGEHFPQDEEGGYAGHHPADSEDAIGELERLREAGAEYLVFPSTSIWWLDHYRPFARHLARYRKLHSGRCEIFELALEASAEEANTISR
jgi:GT2 family glycosyltransferase